MLVFNIHELGETQVIPYVDFIASALPASGPILWKALHRHLVQRMHQLLTVRAQCRFATDDHGRRSVHVRLRLPGPTETPPHDQQCQEQDRDSASTNPNCHKCSIVLARGCYRSRNRADHRPADVALSYMVVEVNIAGLQPHVAAFRQSWAGVYV